MPGSGWQARLSGWQYEQKLVCPAIGHAQERDRGGKGTQDTLANNCRQLPRCSAGYSMRRLQGQGTKEACDPPRPRPAHARGCPCLPPLRRPTAPAPQLPGACKWTREAAPAGREPERQSGSDGPIHPAAHGQQLYLGAVDARTAALVGDKRGLDTMTAPPRCSYRARPCGRFMWRCVRPWGHSGFHMGPPIDIWLRQLRARRRRAERRAHVRALAWALGETGLLWQ